MKIGLHGAAAPALFVGMMGCAYAQSNVVLYGIVDDALSYSSRTLNSSTGRDAGHQIAMIDGQAFGSRFGMTGVEDFGGGLKASFKLESGINIANGSIGNSNGNLFGRQAWLQLGGNFGSVTAGLQFCPFVLALIESDARGASDFGSLAPIYVDSVLTTGLFNSNAITYSSPTFAGLQGSVMIALGGEAGNFQAARQYSGSLTYDRNGVFANVAFYSGNAGDASTSAPASSTVAFMGRTIGVGYTFSNLTFRAVFVNFKIAGSFDSRVYGGGVSYAATPALTLDAGAWLTRDGNDTSNHSILVATGVRYLLSKRTMLYTQFGYVSNSGKMDTGLSNDGPLYLPSGEIFGANVGITHSF
ncbi:porin [Paraburkholderia elongata]|uniref:Porin n=1 Tax=Paraburkholderia elongata TaxID=2675747 RepID=A0A972NI83_9BURK|nr:porin [Paraburkholderia elongata]NPT53838.1 porin [Paraburkholderia elongata]